MAYRIGIDAGSKTIKVVVVDDDGKIIHSIYRRHRFDIKTTVREAVHDLAWRYGDLEGTVGVTGSAGIGLADVLGLPFVQEVVATTRAVQAACPEADAVIELGGEDAKIVYLSGGLEQRMNATCAGGTGGFIDTIAFMIGVRARDMSNLSLRANRIYPIASRCAVFAQTDVRPLLNAGASAADIAGSALEAVVRQTIGGLACGRPIEGTVVFLGGPLEHIPDLVRRFRVALGLTARTGIKPPDAHLFTALGAAVVAAEGEEARTMSLRGLERAVEQAPNPKNDLPRLEPLFGNADDVAAFRERHADVGPERVRCYDARGDLYLGIDAGSTAVKIAVIDEEGRLAHSDYRPTEGDALATAIDMLEQLYVDLARTYAGESLALIAHATATGYGENLLRAALGVDSGVVETTAHVTAALEYVPDLTFLLDIGGQDIKAIWVRDGMIEEAVLNEACSSGCGSFIEGTARSLRSTPSRFAEQALSAEAPVDLGTKCTVFMTSRVRHAQKAGASVGDLAAGAAYSVVRNALFRIIGVNSLDSLGDTIVAQGGTFMSDAVLRAFEKLLGREVVRPKTARLMGAIGCALVARDRARRARSETGRAKSGILGAQALQAFSPKRRRTRCPGCENACELSIISFGTGLAYIDGNRCDRAESFVDLGPGAERVSTSLGLARLHKGPKPPNAVALEQALLARFSSTDGSEKRGRVYVGIVDALYAYDQTPFWHTLVSVLGFSVIMPRHDLAADPKRRDAGLDTIPSESVCYPAKLSHARLFSLLADGATAILMPQYVRGNRCPVSCEYANALRESAPALDRDAVAFASPLLKATSPERIADSPEDRGALFESVASLAPPEAPICREEFDEAFRAALVAQRRFADAVARGNERAIAWAHEPGRHGVLLAGRPYHADPAVLHGIDGVLEGLGFSVVAAEALDLPRGGADGGNGAGASGCADAAGGGAGGADGAAAAVGADAADGVAAAVGADAADGVAARGAMVCPAEACGGAGGAAAAVGADASDGADGAAASDGADGAAASCHPWRASKHLAKLARLAIGDPSLDLVCLQSFDCLYDALSIPDAHDLMRAARRPFTALKIDDIADTTHLRIRLRTLAETIERVEARPGGAAGASGAESPAVSAPLGGGERVAGGRVRVAGGRVRVAASAPPKAVEAARVGSAEAFAGLDQADADTARMHVNDVCFVASALAGRAIRITAAAPDLTRLVVPHVCESCVLDGLGHIVERACGRAPEIVWKPLGNGGAAGATDGGAAAATGGRAVAAEGDGEAGAAGGAPRTFAATGGALRTPAAGESVVRHPIVGLVGAAPLVFDPFMNDGLVAFAEAAGCDVALPDARLLDTDDVRYLPQLDAFFRAGVDHVIHLVSFGCLKGHVAARGALRTLARRYPDMPITVIDYDPEASALNRENRVRLALEAARRTAEARARPTSG